MNFINELKMIDQRLQNGDTSVTEEERLLLEQMGPEIREWNTLVKKLNGPQGAHCLPLDNGQSGSLLQSSPTVAFGVNEGHKIGQFYNIFSWINQKILDILNQAAEARGLLETTRRAT